jgi:hypothetical protein
MNHKGFDAGAPQPPSQPKAVTSSLEGNDNACYGSASLFCPLAPSGQDAQQTSRTILCLL